MAPGSHTYHFIHADYLNTPRFITDQDNRPVWRWDNDEPFGANPPNENPSGLGTFEFPLRDEGAYFERDGPVVGVLDAFGIFQSAKIKRAIQGRERIGRES